MHKKIIKRGNNEYFYYYTNIRKDGKVKNIFLSSDDGEEEENGFLNQIELSPQRIFYSGFYKYINISFLLCKATDAQLGRALALRAGSPKGIQVQNFHCKDESPVRGAQNGVDNV